MTNTDQRWKWLVDPDDSRYALATEDERLLMDAAETHSGLVIRVDDDAARLIIAAPVMRDLLRNVAHWQPAIEPEQAAQSSVDRLIYDARAILISLGEEQS